MNKDFKIIDDRVSNNQCKSKNSKVSIFFKIVIKRFVE